MSETTRALRVRGRAPSLRGDATVPGDKSIGHRAVIFGALASGHVRVRGLSGGEDNLRTVLALRALGVSMRDAGTGALDVDGVGLGGLRAAAGELDCGNSGTSIRLLAGLLAAQPFRSRLTGDRYLQARPMRRVADPLRAMGASVDGAAGKKAGELYPPLDVGGASARLRGLEWRSPIASAQVKSAVLLAGLYADDRVYVFEPATSRDHTERMLKYLGAPVHWGDELDDRDYPIGAFSMLAEWPGGVRQLAARDLDVPGDLSSAAFVLGAATLAPGSAVRVRGVGVNPTRTGFLDALRAMGGDVRLVDEREQAGEPVADLECRAAPLRAIEIAGELTVRAIDELPLVAALAAHADGTTTIRDAQELRVKESDRIASTAAMLRAFGVEVEELPDGMRVAGGGALRAGVVDSRGDHRIAMAGAVCALALDGDSVIEDVENIATSFPGFERTLAALGADLR
jgi:3-phosphoshikimate 1-carboxyvinyltransferase